jgi:hypothetical protein
MSKQSSAALTRSCRGDRVLVSLVGLLLLAAGVLALVVAQGWLGFARSDSALDAPTAAHWVAGHDLAVLIGGIVVGLALLVFGLTWFARSVRPERRSDLVLGMGTESALTVTSTAIGEAMRADCEGLDGVHRARVRSVGTAEYPAIRVHLCLDDGTDLRAVWSELESGVLPRVHQSLGMPQLPIGVRVELDSAEPPRVR